MKLDLTEEVFNPHTVSVFIKANDTYVGIIDYMNHETNWFGFITLRLPREWIWFNWQLAF